MTDQQIRLYALARTVVPPEFLVRSFRDASLEIFPRIGVKVDETTFELGLDEKLCHATSDAMILREIEDRFWEDPWYGTWDYQREPSGGI